jgi:hypothetical protein
MIIQKEGFLHVHRIGAINAIESGIELFQAAAILYCCYKPRLLSVGYNTQSSIREHFRKSVMGMY